MWFTHFCFTSFRKGSPCSPCLTGSLYGHTTRYVSHHEEAMSALTIPPPISLQYVLQFDGRGAYEYKPIDSSTEEFGS